MYRNRVVLGGRRSALVQAFGQGSRVALAACLLAAAGGCGNGAPSVDTTTEETVVKGVITVHGKPATKGTITFNPSNYKRVVMAKSADIGANGEYSTKTLVGQNLITLKLPGSRIKGLEYEEFFLNAVSGENTFNLELPQTGTAPSPSAKPASGKSSK